MIRFKCCLFTNHSPAVCTDWLESVQESENTIPEVSLKTFVVLIRRVQSPLPLGDSSLRVQLGPILIWNVLPTVGSTPRGSSLLWSTCSIQEQALYNYICRCIHISSVPDWFLLTHVPLLSLQTARKVYPLFILSFSVSEKFSCDSEHPVISTTAEC